ncbi:CoA transferase [Amycolatopsis sp. K13G38]|uniref:CoA transferase n=1 Tax=Amycolatopsis acididurans TaxID=2724524 RepID=A0ABX1J9F1_9PSEU|nr:CaiB/BaiF CoA-transferase family protein [Amycolatopsis acididurans]NKQ55524.1 CoA transferase [Amycolatopsis acididurans]
MRRKPLQNIRVLEFGGYISAPYASSLLAALGADVVKVERPGIGEDFRRAKNDQSPYFRQYNAGKRSFAVDLKDPRGVELVKAVLPRFDVLLENLRPGKLAALGLGPQVCRELRPDLVYTSVTGFGDGGPLRARAAYDSIGQAVGGIYSIMSNAGAAQISGTCLADLVTGLSTATGILAALVGRGSSGLGEHVETSMMEAVSTVTIDAITQFFDDGHTDPSRQSRHPQAQNFCLKTASGQDITLHLSSSQKFWLALLDAMDRRDLADDPRFTTYTQRWDNYFELVDIVQAEFMTKPADEWEKLLSEADVPFAPVLGMGGYLSHPQTEWLKLTEPETDDLALVRPPWRFSGTRPDRGRTTPRVGQHTREIAAEVYDESRVDELVAAGVLFTEDRFEKPAAERKASA